MIFENALAGRYIIHKPKGAVHRGTTMTFNDVIMWIMAVGAVIGGLDLIFGNRFGLGEKFEDGFKAMGPLALAMVGIICLAPVIAEVLGPIISPVFTYIGADPALFASVLANDSGGYALAMNLAIDKDAGLFSGLLVASMLGCTIVLTPVGLIMLPKWDQPYFAKGLLIGLIAIPFGALAGGLIGGFNFGMVIANTIPVAVFSILLAVGLKFIPEKMIKGCLIFGKFIFTIVIAGLIIAAFESMTGIAFIKGLDPIKNAMEIIGIIGVILLGTFPVMAIITKVLQKPLALVGEKLDLDNTSTAGLIVNLANPIPVFQMIPNMRPRGKIINTAWLVPATAALGDHLGFTAGVEPEYITMVVFGKLIAGSVALVLGLMLTKSTDIEDRQSDEIRKTVEGAEKAAPGE